MVNKKAFTLSVNFLVTMIIMIVLFGFGIYLFTTVFNESVKMNEEISSREVERMNRVLDTGEIVSVLNPQQTAGKDPLRFPIGITNENGNPTNEFNITIESCVFKDMESNIGNNYNTEPNKKIIQIAQDTQNGFEIPNNQRDHRLLLVTPKDSGGFYSIKLQVYRESDPYGKKQMIFVTVP